MPWELQVCRFCGKGYGHKTGLRNHLSQYVGVWRCPADGIHDVLEIQKILSPEDDDSSKYKCPSRDCRKIFATRQKFTEHVITRSHWGGFPEPPLKDTDEEITDLSNISEWVLPFDEEAVKVFEPEGPFPFLRLPPELRLMVYEMTLCYLDINIYAMEEEPPSHRQGKVFLQGNADNNPLSILLASRGIYDEARAIFYSQNRFIFYHLDAIPVFLIGIGQANAKLLRSLKWMRDDESQFENRLRSIRPHIWGIDGGDSTSNEKLSIWNDHSTYLSFLEIIGRTSCMYPLPEPHRFLRWNPRITGRTNRVRFRLHYRFYNTLNRFMHSYGRLDGQACYEMILHVEKSGW